MLSRVPFAGFDCVICLETLGSPRTPSGRRWVGFPDFPPGRLSGLLWRRNGLRLGVFDLALGVSAPALAGNSSRTAGEAEVVDPLDKLSGALAADALGGLIGALQPWPRCG
jgi:hypothetical protein